MLCTLPHRIIQNSSGALLLIVLLKSNRLDRLWHIRLSRRIYSQFKLVHIKNHAGRQNIHVYRSATHQRNVVFVLVVAFSNRITGLAVRSAHESFGSSSQQTSPAEGQPYRGAGDADVNHNVKYE